MFKEADVTMGMQFNTVSCVLEIHKEALLVAGNEVYARKLISNNFVKLLVIKM